jgi:PAS domain S-box-containing protein
LYYPFIVAAALWFGPGPGLVAALLSWGASWVAHNGDGPVWAVGQWGMLRGKEFSLTRQVAMLGADLLLVGLCGGLREARALAARQARQTAEVLDRITDCFVAVDNQWRFTYVNPQIERIYKISGERMLGRPLWEVAPKLVGTEIEVQLRLAMVSRQPIELETRSGLRPHLWIELRAYPSASGLSIYFRDVTARKRAADVLKAGDDLLRLIADTVPVFIGYIDRDHRYRFANRRYGEWFGVPIEQVVGRRMSEMHPPAAWEVMRPRIDEALGGKQMDFEREIQDPRGELHWVKASYVPDRGPDGVVRGVVVVIIDETRRKRIEQEVERSEHRYRMFVQSSSEAIWRCESSFPLPIHLPLEAQVNSIFDHTYLAECNDAMARMYGFDSAEKFVGAKLVDWMPPDDPHNAQFVRAFVQNGYRLTDVESHQVDRDGNAKFFRNSLVGVVENGRLVRGWGTQRDITAQKQAEASIREGEQRLRLALDAARCGAWDWDIVNDRVTWSERVYELHGLKPGEFGGRVEDFRRLVHPDDLEHVGEALRLAMECGKPYDIEFRCVWPDESIHWLATRARVAFDPEGRPLRMFGVVTETTQRKAAELEREHLLASERAARGEAERANRMKDEFLATVSHELRTPLNAILGWSQLLHLALKRGNDVSEDLPHALETIERNARVQAQIIDDLLDMSRIISGKLRLEVQAVDLAVVIGAAVESVRHAAEAKGIALVRDVPAALLAGVRVRGDAARLQQVMWNVLSNAIKFTPRGGRVSICVRQRCDGEVEGGGGDSVEIQVSDSGQGIKAEFLPHVFERFRQADASAARRHNGLGLGLAIVKHLMEQHGGTVAAHSDGEGCGAMFTLALPAEVAEGGAGLEVRREPDSAGAPSAAAPILETQSLRGVRVLVVDDEADARELVRRVLEDCEARVATASSAIEGLEMLSTFGPDVLVSDIGMPGFDGFEFIRRVRSMGHAEHKAIPAAALTAFARAEDHERVITAGYQVHVPKPVEPSALVATVARLAEGKGNTNS